MDNNWKSVATLLPKQPCDDLMQDVLSTIYDGDSDSDCSLGENLILFHRESVETADESLYLRTMDPQAWDRYEATRKRRWGSRCTCTMCGEDFVAGYTSKGIVLAEGEDGMLYEGYTSPGPSSIEYHEGDIVQCPRCTYHGILTRRAELRKGRNYQTMQAETICVSGYVVLMFWLVNRRQNDAGEDYVLFYPHMALLVDRCGRLRRFRAVRVGNDVTDVDWIPCASTRDPMQIPYHCYGAVNSRRVGGWTCAYGPDLTGTTGEKTALDKYIGAGGCWPGAYLHIWAKHPNVENLMRQGFALAVQETVDCYLDRCVYSGDLRDAPPISWVDWAEVKPNKMLHMSRVAFRAIREARWSEKDANCWSLYRSVFPSADAMEYELCRKKVGVCEVRKLLEMVQAGWVDLTPIRVVRYLEKQDQLTDGVQHLIDYRKISHELGLGETEEVCWPRDLMAAHDRVAQNWAARADLQYSLGFTTTYLSLRDLEWTDGDLCIVVPKAEQELVDEGRILRHCVGTYGKTHCNGKPIFFVRHRRRPERSYYTLNIDLTGKLPREIQLHGYGNERHGPNKEYRHSIPKSVRDFCDRWQREILLPWFVDRQAGNTRTKEKKNKKATAA